MRFSSASLITFGTSIFATTGAFAGVPAPAPSPGAFGPLGIVVVVVGYGVYRMVQHLRKR